LPELRRHATLVVAELRVLALVQLLGHRLQLRDYVGEFRQDGSRDDVIHGKPIPQPARCAAAERTAPGRPQPTRPSAEKAAAQVRTSHHTPSRPADRPAARWQSWWRSRSWRRG